MILSLALVVAIASPVLAASYTLSVQTTSTTYTGSVNITVTGQVSPAPGQNTSVLLRVYNPGKALATFADVPVNGTTGQYSFTFAAGGSSAWVGGTYLVNATWGAYGPVIFKVVTFSWTSSGTTTSTSSTSSTVTTTTSSSRPSTGTSVSTTSSTSSISTTATTTSSSTTVSTSSITTTGSSTTGTANVPEFPFQIVAAVAFSALIVCSYLVIRSRRARVSTPGSFV